jgi:Zn-dependent peptidase ImmA (M78 family)
MKAPPRRAERGEDFRSLATPATARDNALLGALLRDIRARQEMVKSLLEDEDETSPLPFVGSASMGAGVDAVVRSIARTLNYDPFDQATRNRSASPDNLFRELRTRSEKAGIFVLLVGDLGSHHSAISEGVFRGLAIADSVAPFVIINDQDAKSARTFTLIHELAHIWLGETGISGTPEAVVTSTPRGRTEQFCNDVAGEFLLPSSAFTAKPPALVDSSKESAHSRHQRVGSDLGRQRAYGSVQTQQTWLDWSARLPRTDSRLRSAVERR